MTDGLAPRDSSRDVNQAAPVIATSEIQIAASPELVWTVLTDFQRWPTWNPEVKSMSFSGDVVRGSEFRWKSGPGTITSTIQRVEHSRLIAWTGKTLGTRAAHVYRLEPRDAGTLVTTEESLEGLIARLAKGSMQRTLQKSLATGLQHLKARVESAGEGRFV